MAELTSKSSIRYISGGEVQRWLCRDCGWFRRPKRISIAGTPINDRVPPEMLCSKEKPTAVNI